MSKPSYDILITSLEAYGHINAICGFGELLARHGHKVTFVSREKYKKFADRRGFKFIPIDENILGSVAEEDINKFIDDNMEKFRCDPMERFKNYTEEEIEANSLNIDQFRRMNEAIVQILAENSFDAIVHDALDVLDCFYKTTIPVIPTCSSVPLRLYNNGPPGWSGLSVNSEPKLWDEFNKNNQVGISKIFGNFRILMEESGRPVDSDKFRWVLSPKYFGFYHYPGDLDYVECEPREPGWHRIDCYIRSPDEGPFELPEKLKDKPGKLIYFSLGSTASNDLLIMNKCLSALNRCGHRVIVSMGRRGDQLKLSDNMWGQEYVNQIAIIEKVDLVITHGGNNTFMETLYHGKPMIIIPWFFDQLDNAQRVVDKKIGFRVNPWEFDEDYFLDCIDKILNDQQLQERVKKISENMRNSDSGEKAVQMIENLIAQSKSS